MMLPWTPPSPATLLVFVVIVGAVCACFLLAVGLTAPVRRRGRQVLVATLGLGAWLALHAWWAGHIEAWMPASVPATLLLILATVVGLASSPLGRQLTGVPLIALVAFPAFRLPLELVLHSWGDQGVIPMSMTWSGQNLDVLAGLLGPAFAAAMWWWPTRARALAWLGNTACFLLLLNVIRVAVRSSPGPLQLYGDPPLVLVLHVPECWIASVCVAGAMLGHLVTYRALLQSRRTPG